MGIQLIIMTALVAFYGYHVIRMICRKKKGIQIDQIGEGKAGFVKLIEVTMRIFTFLVLGTGIINVVLDTSNGPIPIRIIDAVVGAVDTAIFTTAILTMRSSWWVGMSPADKVELVTNGIYQFSRSPASLGLDPLYIGILLMFFSWGLCAASVFITPIYHLRIVYMEEALLPAAFRGEYLQYKKKVCHYTGTENGYEL